MDIAVFFLYKFTLVGWFSESKAIEIHPAAVFDTHYCVQPFCSTTW